MTDPVPRRRRVVIIGAGFGGLSAAKALAQADVDVVVIDRHNYHLFAPLLYQVATAGLSPAEIASPIRAILRDQSNATVLLAEVSNIDLGRREVQADSRGIPYDDLIVATGARDSYFGHSDWEGCAPGLKSIDDATELRRRILLAFERAEMEGDPEVRSRLLTFVIVGAGPTGVEMAGAIAELAKRALARDFRAIDPTQARIVLVEAGPRILSAFDPELSRAAMRALGKMGVEVRVHCKVTNINAREVALKDDVIKTETVVWAAGVTASRAGDWLDASTDKAGRVIVNGDLSLPGRPEVFVIGDTAHASGPDGNPLPGVAAVAKQQGEYVARLLRVRLRGEALPDFAYRDYGLLATIGRKRAIAQFGTFQLTGFVAWLIWSVVHIYFLIGFRNRLAVAMNWAWNYITFQRGTRLITGPVRGTGVATSQAAAAKAERALAPSAQPHVTLAPGEHAPDEEDRLVTRRVP